MQNNMLHDTRRVSNTDNEIHISSDCYVLVYNSKAVMNHLTKVLLGTLLALKQQQLVPVHGWWEENRTV